MRLATLEARGTRSGEMLTLFLPENFSDRTAEATKGVRRKPEYKQMAAVLLSSD